MNPAEQETLIVADPSADCARVWSIGTEIEGRYRVLEMRGGRGVSGMGVVYILEEEGRCLAAKTFQCRFAQRLDFIERFLREARTWILLGTHPNIVRAHYLDIIDATPYLFMEFVPGDDAGRYAVSEFLRQGPLPVLNALDYGTQICEGMIHAVAVAPGLVHRDLKPENLLVTREGVIKITDFGLVRCRATGEYLERTGASETPGDYAALTQAGAVFGTPAYMAPEQFQDPAAVTGAADLYAFGCCLYEMLVGVPPFLVTAQTTLERLIGYRRKHESQEPPPLREVLPDCPRELDHVVNRCLEKEPERRWAHFAEVRERLAWLIEHVLGGEVRDVARVDPSAREVAEQTRSLFLLEGYERAIRMRHLRENQSSSPYAFHLALASYFHVRGDAIEERRQLEKALRNRGGQAGGEAMRRIGDLLMAQSALREAEARLTAFLEQFPDSLDFIFEPFVRLRIAQGRYAEAESLLEAPGNSLRGRLLRVELLKAAGRTDELAALLRTMLEEELARVTHKLTLLAPDSRAGWERPEDPDLLIDVLAVLRPDRDTSLVHVADQVFWPDITGEPDFSDSLAWLSLALGELAELGTPGVEPAGGELARLAALLDYPDRLPRYLDRDESWFWVQGHPGQESENDV